jgi:hypothetical protein
MATKITLEEESGIVEIMVDDRIKSAAERAAIAAGKPVGELLEDILAEYLIRSGYLRDPVSVSRGTRSIRAERR